ncbi:hypothetical protein [Paenibacillus hamazuiensis]|uniref:hypothetical protein n=1 Tax=Paenibacillus hamazuiensis TaxID=2936508 RepID=UPI00200D86AD|nr:hypothetical protein [Paenibacillus hamazuiensis]
MAEEYKRSFEYSYEENSDYFLDKLFGELESLTQNEKIDMLKHVLREVFSPVEFTPNQRSIVYKLFNLDEHEFNYKPFYLHNFFNSLYNKIEKNNMELSLRDLLAIYRWHDNTVKKSIDNLQDDQGESYFNKLLSIYSSRTNWTNGDCVYFKLPSVIRNRISSLEDIEEIHRHVIGREGFNVIQEADRFNNPVHENSRKVLVQSYDMYLENMLDHYKNYLTDLKLKQHSYFLGAFSSNNRTDFLDDRTSDVIYNYITYMEYTEQNKEYAIFLANKLDYKYKVSLVFYHLLYTGPSWEWKKDILFFRHIINAIWVNESVTSEHVLEFVCYKIENRSGRRIDSDLIKWISQQTNITRLNEEIVNRCLRERHMSYAKLLMFIYIFSDNRHYPMDFYNFDLNRVTTSYHRDWKIEFLEEMLQTPKLLGEEFFVQHLLYFCQKISYTTDHFIFENDFRVFFINRFFKFSESQYIELLENHYLGKGIIEFLILCLGETGYEYLMERSVAKSFSSEVRVIINRENKLIEDYIEGLVSQANECRNIISNFKKNEITKRIESML